MRTELKLAAFRDRLHARSDALLAMPARRLAERGVTANHVTVAGLVLTLPAALLAANAHYLGAGVIFLLASLLDLFDGALARAAGRSSSFGALLDSTLDRIGEAAMLAALAWRFAVEGDALMVVVSMAALTGGFLTSYVRARAEGLGIECREGGLTRPERVLLLGFGLLFGQPRAAVVLLAVLSLLAAAQRLYIVNRATAERPR